MRIAPSVRTVLPVALAAALAAIYLVWEPPSLDLAAADYRAWLFGHQGLAVWDLQWYAGHHLPGYSVLFPPLGWWLGTRLTGALSAVVAAFLFQRLALARYGSRAWIGAAWFGAGTATNLFTGRLPFALGVVPALAALLALQRSRTARGDGTSRRAAHRRRALVAAAVALAVVSALASPVDALFLGLAGAALAVAERRPAGLAVAAAALGAILALSAAFPEGGVEPFPVGSLWPVLAFTPVILVLLPRGEHTLRIAVVLYLIGCLAAFVIDTPVGSNVVRLGALCAGPVLALTLWPRRKLVLAVLALPLLWWQWTAPVGDVRSASGDPSVGAAFYRPLLAFLDAHGGPPGFRVEIPFTRLHWEARHVAPHYALARGWERQLDTAVNGLFYDGPLTPARYRAWLLERAVRWVALPMDIRLDYSAEQEARLIRGGLPYLRLAWSDRDWRVYAVAGATTLVAAGPARVTATDTNAVTLAVAAPGQVRLRVHWTPYWAVAAGGACVAKDGDWTALDVRRAGTVRLVTRFALGRIRATSPRCPSGG